MPTLVHLQARILEDSNGNGGISGTAIALIICLGLIPSLAVIWTVCYLFWAYPNDRNCCCRKRRKRADKQDALDQRQAALSEETLYEKQGVALPQRPFAAQTRTESGSSSGSGRLTKNDPNRPGTGISKHQTRMSLQSVGSASTVYVTHEPKPFV